MANEHTSDIAFHEGTSAPDGALEGRAFGWSGGDRPMGESTSNPNPDTHDGNPIAFGRSNKG